MADFSPSNQLLNSGFEAAFAFWMQNNAVLDGSTVKDGNYSHKLAASGSAVIGGSSAPIIIDQDVSMQISCWLNVTAFTAGTLRVKVMYWQDRNAATLSVPAAEFIVQKAAVTSGWEQYTKTIGKSGSGKDLTFPATCIAITIEMDWVSTPTGTAYVDTFEVKIIDNDLSISGLESWSVSRPKELAMPYVTLGGGFVKASNVGPQLQYVELKINHLTDAQRASLIYFIDTVCGGMARPFQYTDDRGIVFSNCLWAMPSYDFQATHPNVNADTLLIVCNPEI